MAKLKNVFSLLLKATAKRKALAISLCSIFILVVASGIYVSQNLIHEVYIDGVSIGYVQSYDEYESALASIEETDGSSATEKISTKLRVALSEIKEDFSHLEDVSSSTLAYASYKASDMGENNVSNYSVGQAVARQLTAASELASVETGDTEASSTEEAVAYSREELAAQEDSLSKEQGSDDVSQAPDKETQAEPDSSESDNPKEEKLYVHSVTIENLAREILNLKQPATSIVINGVHAATVETESDASAAIEAIKEHYTPKNERYSVLSVSIPEEITTAPVHEAIENILSIDAAAEKIIDGIPNPHVYTINEGDTIWDIAMTNSVSTNKIQASNPEMDMDKLQIGDEITLPLADSYVHVEVKAKSTTQESVPYETKEVSDKTLLKGKTKVTQAGENGIQEIVTSVKLVNGTVTSEDIVSTKTIKAPVNKIIAVGTKVVAASKPASKPSSKPSSSTSSSSSSSSTSSKGFIRPSVGILTSNYGWRSRGFHTGVDFAAATGTRIVASKAGTVTFSGWKGGYGNCVIIDHGNGISTLYAHNSSNKVSVGQYVSQGQTIALMGSTGNSTGPHVHFEVRVNGVHKNPWNYIN